MTDRSVSGVLGIGLVAAIATGGALLSPTPRVGLVRFVALNLLVLTTARAGARWLGPASAPEMVLRVAVLALAQIVTIVTWLGASGLLYLPLVAIAVALPALAVTVVGRTPPMDGACAAPAGPVPPRAARLGVALGALVLAAPIAAHLALSYRRLMLPPTDYDALVYHLMGPASWQVRHDLHMLKIPFGGQAKDFMPLNVEVFAYWLLAPFRHSDLFAKLAALPFAFGGAIAIGLVGVDFGLSRVVAAIVAAGFLAMPEMIEAASGAGTDVPTAALFLSTLYAGIRATSEYSPRALWFAAVNLGLLIGTKYNAMVYGLLIVAGLAPLWLRSSIVNVRAAGRPVPASIGRDAALVLATCGVLGGYCYLRNLIWTGTPFHPAGYGFLDGLARGELVVGTSFPIDPGWAIPSHREVLFGRQPLTGVLIPLLGVPAFVHAAWVVLAGSAAPRRRYLIAMVGALALAIYGVWVALIWDHRTMRFLFAALACVLLLIGILLDRMRHRPRVLVLAALAALVVELARAGTLGAPLAVTVALAVPGALSWLSRWAPRRRRAVARGVLGVALGLAVVVAPRVSATYEQTRRTGWVPTWPGGATYAQGWEVVDAATEATPERDVVAYVGGNTPYPLLGSRLENEVVFVPTTPLRPPPFRSGDQTFALGREEARSSDWLRHLHDLEVGWIVLRTDNLGAPVPEQAWIRARPHVFAPVHERGPDAVLRVRSDLPLASLLRGQVDFSRSADEWLLVRGWRRVERTGESPDRSWVVMDGRRARLTLPAGGYGRIEGELGIRCAGCDGRERLAIDVDGAEPRVHLLTPGTNRLAFVAGAPDTGRPNPRITLRRKGCGRAGACTAPLLLLGVSWQEL